ncbi:tumor necrosis factor receptor superfamily member 4 isoform X1 [Chelonia mydas]|uniref:tumor necrosis factor receptor superfamily member 4 isoform X1 n=2 Tax=Chelonia mydas TaxID=8469 RepID=UPI0018A23B08|nr:tumor necrosis factor receptor superfamily member 4 isoform X1 [Chelonia mydas]
MAGRGLAKFVFSSFTAVLFFLLLSAMQCSGLICGQFEYPLHKRCCRECAPGEEMKNRCSPTSETECLPCQHGYYNSKHNYYPCKSCTVCDTDRGSMEVKKCDKISDTVCMCMKGYTPYDSRSSEESPSGKECFPCPDGHFSNGNNDRCRPWVNCIAYGKKTLKPGTKTEDAICDDQDKRATTLQTSTLYLSLISHRSNGSTTASTPFTSKDTVSTTPVKKEINWGSLSLILICLTLLMVSGMSILLLTIQTTKKDKTKRPPVNGQLATKIFDTYLHHGDQLAEEEDWIDTAC